MNPRLASGPFLDRVPVEVSSKILFDAGSGGRAHVQTELPGIHGREKAFISKVLS